MRFRLTFPHALTAAALTAAAATAALPAAATADSAWLAPITLSTGADPVSIDDSQVDPTRHNRLVAAPDGTVTVFWLRTDGSNLRVAFRTRSATTRSWSDAEWATPAGEDARTFEPAVDDAGNVTLLWTSTYQYVRAATLLAGADHFGDTTVLATGNISGLGLVAGPNHDIVAAISVNTTPEIVLHRLAAGSETWDEPVSVPAGGTPQGIGLAYNADGDGVLVWGAVVNSDNQILSARVAAGSNEWVVDPAPIATNTPVNEIRPVVDTAGNRTVTWSDGNDQAIVSARSEAGSTSWSAPTPVSDQPYGMLVTSVVDRDGNVTVAWQRLISIVGNEYLFAVVTNTWSAATGAWSGQVTMPGGNPGGEPTLLSNGVDDVTLLYAGVGGTTPDLFSVAHSANGVDWEEPVTTPVSEIDFRYGLIAPAIDPDGNITVSLGASNGGAGYVSFTTLDAAPPRLDNLVIPATGDVDSALRFSVSPFDLWSSVTTRWDFGDGQTASGNAPSHAYATAGEKTVTVTATDAVGNTFSTTGTVTISAPPVADEPDDTPPVDPPKLLAPIIEAKLAGKTITLNARVTLKAGKKCNSKERGITATTRFGNTTYRTTLKLGLVNGVCRGTATIKLRKTPSARTKLKVSISGKAAKGARSLTTKRS